jgi:hypothetical protein
VNLLLNGIDFLNVIKKAALDAINASQPSDFCFGKVTSNSPLKISVEQKLTLGAAQLVLTRNVTDFKTMVTDGLTKRETTIHNALQVGEEVVLMKQKGGQKYLVLDRLVKI